MGVVAGRGGGLLLLFTSILYPVILVCHTLHSALLSALYTSLLTLLFILDSTLHS
jgi:hypothetical protein